MSADIRHYASQLGGEAVGRNAILCPGPGHSHGDRSLSVRFEPSAPGGFLVYSHAGDNPILCRDYVRERLGLGSWMPNAPPPQPRRVATSTPPALVHDSTDDRIKWALQIWAAATDPRGTVVEAYLNGRGLALDDAVAGEAIRFHPALRCDTGKRAAMVSLLRDIRTDEPCGIHRTFLDGDGRKLDRKMLGRSKGAAVKLDADDIVEQGLVVGEGVESCLAARQIGYRPSWALGSAGAIAGFPVLGGIDTINILREFNDGGANERAIQECGSRWKAAGREVICIRPLAGNDINDAIMRISA